MCIQSALKENEFKIVSAPQKAPLDIIVLWQQQSFVW